ncbi:unnamed protein product, partial [Discosporangium mesarthrocarpum]
QDTLDIVQPGDTITLSGGEYFQDLVTRTDGLADAPITIRGLEGEAKSNPAIIRGARSSHVFNVHHDHYVLEHFTIDGQCGDGSVREHYRNKLIYVCGTHRVPRLIEGKHLTQRQSGQAYLSSVDGLVVRHMTLANCGGECVRLKCFVTHTNFHHNTVTNCGVYDTRFQAGALNGEAVCECV